MYFIAHNRFTDLKALNNMKEINPNLYNLSTFHSLITKQLKQAYNHKGTLNQKIKLVDLLLEKETSPITGATFFAIIDTMNLDVVQICQLFFEDIPAAPLKLSDHGMRNLFGFSYRNICELAQASCLTTIRLEQLIKQHFTHIYAYEIYALATAFGLEAHLLFEYLYSNKKSKPILKLSFIHPQSFDDKELHQIAAHNSLSTGIATIVKDISSEIRENQILLFEYLINETDFFLTPRSTNDIIKEIEDNHNISIDLGRVHNFLKKYTKKELNRVEVPKFNRSGTVCNKNELRYVKDKKEPSVALQNTSENRPWFAEAGIANLKQIKQEIQQAKLLEEMEEIEKLYDLIVANPGKRIDLYLTVFNIRAKTIENRLQQLKMQNRIQYLGKYKKGGYWAVTAVQQS